MSTQIQQARDVFASAGINASGDAIDDVKPEPKQDEVIEDDAQNEEAQGNDEENQEINADAEQEEVTEDKEEVTQAADSYTVETLAEAIGFETPELYSMLKIPMADGSDPIALGEVKDQFTTINRENEALKTQMTDMQGQLEMAKASGGASVSGEKAQAQAYIQQLQASLSSDEMTELKEYDPTRYLIQSQEIKDKVDQAFTYMNQLDQKQQIEQRATLEGFNVKYKELIPSWSDSAAKDKDQKLMSDYMLSKGFSADEVNHMADPRIQVVLKELVDLRAEKNAATEAVEKVRKAPKVIGNTRVMPKVDKTQKTQKLINKARTSKSKSSILDAARAVMNKG